MIKLSHLSLAYGAEPLVADLDLHIEQGQWVALLGRSGCGKSTLIKAIAGIDHGAEQHGDITLHNDDGIAYMAQKDALLPWLSILDNVQLRHRLHGSQSKTTAKQARAMLGKVGLGEHADKPPYQLSGGQRQRAALARTLMSEASIVLMDEPFSAVDAITRLELQRLAVDLLGDKTVLLITHDPLEAIRLADVIYVMRDGGVSMPFFPDGARPRFDPEAAQPVLQAKLLEALS